MQRPSFAPGRSKWRHLRRTKWLVRLGGGPGLQRTPKLSVFQGCSRGRSRGFSPFTINGGLTGLWEDRDLYRASSWREFEGMYRVALAAAVAVTLSGCSLGSVGISSGFAEAPATASVDASSSFASKKSSQLALGGEPKAERAHSLQPAPRLPRFPTRRPQGTFEKAPAGALQDRDYSGTSLNPEKARDLINQYRRDKGLKPLKLNPALTEAAKEHSRDLAKWDRISHYGSDGSNPWDRVKRIGLQGQARGRERRHGPGQLRRGLERLEGKPRPQQEPAAWATRRKWASRWFRIRRPSSSRSGRWSSAPPCEALLQEPAA